MQGDRATAKLLCAQPATDALREGQQHRFDRRAVERVAIECVRMSDRLGRPAVADDLALVDPVGALPDMPAVLPEACLDDPCVHRCQVADRSETPPLENLACLRADAPESTELERREKGLLASRRDDDQTIGLAQVRADLRAQLVRRDPDREDQTESLAHVPFEVS